MIILSELFTLFKALFEILLPSGFEYPLTVFFPMLDLQFIRTLSLRQPQLRSYCLDLFVLPISQKEISQEIP